MRAAVALTSGFDPAQAVTLWENMKKAGGDKPPEMLSTHPSDERRIQQIRDRLPDSQPLLPAGARRRARAALQINVSARR